VKNGDDLNAVWQLSIEQSIWEWAHFAASDRFLVIIEQVGGCTEPLGRGTNGIEKLLSQPFLLLFVI
jgi:hypothetical protein